MVSAWWLMTAFLAGATVSGVWFWLQDCLDRGYLDQTYGMKEGDQRRSSSSGGSVPSALDSASQMAEQGIDGGVAG
jgi:hypothetical protein